MYSYYLCGELLIFKKLYVMKRCTLMVIVMLMMFVNVFAQKGEKGVSVNLGYGSGSLHKSFKVGAEFQYNLTDAIRLAPGFDYFLKSDGLGLWSASVNGNYLFNIKSVEGLKVYPLVGLTVLGTTGAGDEGDMGDELNDYYPDYDEDLENIGGNSGNVTKFGANLGAGIQYPVLSNLDLGFEIKYQFVKDYDQVVFGINASYKF